MNNANNATQTITLWDGSVANIEIKKNESIRIYGVRWAGKPGEKAFDLTFKIGDFCERDSYNLVYLGNIVSIGKTVTVVDQHDYRRSSDGKPRKQRLSLAQFITRNWDFNLAKIRARNEETMMYI